MGVIVTFSYSAWVARYPEFTNVNSDTAQLYFNEATLYLANDGSSPIGGCLPCPPQNPSQPTPAYIQQLTLLNMLTAHIAWLNSAQTNGVPDSNGPELASPLVGRISSGNQGSVSVTATFDFPPGSPQWFNSTKYGAAYWAATAPYRTMQFVPAPQRVFDPWQFGYVNYGGWTGQGNGA